MTPSERERAAAVWAVIRKLGPGYITATSWTRPMVKRLKRLAVRECMAGSFAGGHWGIKLGDYTVAGGRDTAQVGSAPKG